MNKIPQFPTENTKLAPLFSQDLAAIKDQLGEWDRIFGPGKVALWLFDAAFHQLHEAKGFKFTNELLTQTRRGLKRAEGSRYLGHVRRHKRSQQHSSEVA